MWSHMSIHASLDIPLGAVPCSSPQAGGVSGCGDGEAVFLDGSRG